jgi:hypothetical protein
MRNDNHPMSVAELLELADGSWINDGFTAVVRAIERKTSTKTQKPFWKCKLGDTTGSATVSATLFFAPKFSEGSRVDFLGQGLKYKNGSYGPEVSIGDKAEIHVVGTAVQHDGERPASDKAAEAQGFIVNGQTVGMALKEAITLAVQASSGFTRATLADPLFWQDVKTYAGNIIRIGRSLEAGKLSPPSWPVAAREAEAPPPPAPRRTAPTNEREAANLTHNGSDEDVPF